jgi:hypothetical protein
MSLFIHGVSVTCYFREFPAEYTGRRDPGPLECYSKVVADYPGWRLGWMLDGPHPDEELGDDLTISAIVGFPYIYFSDDEWPDIAELLDAKLETEGAKVGLRRAAMLRDAEIAVWGTMRFPHRKGACEAWDMDSINPALCPPDAPRPAKEVALEFYDWDDGVSKHHVGAQVHVRSTIADAVHEALEVYQCLRDPLLRGAAEHRARCRCGGSERQRKRRIAAGECPSCRKHHKSKP